MDVFFVARVIGAAVPLAIVAFFLSRKFLGPGGSAELARLKQIAGVEEAESRAALHFRDWAPYVIALVAGTFGFGFALMGAGSSAASAPAGSFAEKDHEKMAAGFLSGCERRCEGDGYDAPTCTRVCSCVLSGIRAKYPSDEAFVGWFNAAPSDLERMQAELAEVQSQCVSPTAP